MSAIGDSVKRYSSLLEMHAEIYAHAHTVCDDTLNGTNISEQSRRISAIKLAESLNRMADFLGMSHDRIIIRRQP